MGSLVHILKCQIKISFCKKIVVKFSPEYKIHLRGGILICLIKFDISIIQGEQLMPIENAVCTPNFALQLKFKLPQWIHFKFPREFHFSFINKLKWINSYFFPVVSMCNISRTLFTCTRVRLQHGYKRFPDNLLRSIWMSDGKSHHHQKTNQPCSFFLSWYGAHQPNCTEMHDQTTGNSQKLKPHSVCHEWGVFF